MIVKAIKWSDNHKMIFTSYQYLLLQHCNTLVSGEIGRRLSHDTIPCVNICLTRHRRGTDLVIKSDLYYQTHHLANKVQQIRVTSSLNATRETVCSYYQAKCN